MYYGSMINKDYPGYVQENGFSCQGNFTKGFYISKFINKKIFPKLRQHPTQNPVFQVLAQLCINLQSFVRIGSDICTLAII